MKKAALFLLVLLIAPQTFGQRKSKSEAPDPRDLQIDSLTKVSSSLTLNLDSVSKELVKYIGVYEAIKEKVIHYNFDPTRSAYLIDSMKATRDSASLLLSNTSSRDSLLNENILLKTKLDSVKTLYEQNKITISAEEMERAKALSSLKQLKELLDAKIITDAEFATLKSRYLQKL